MIPILAWQAPARRVVPVPGFPDGPDVAVTVELDALASLEAALAAEGLAWRKSPSFLARMGIGSATVYHVHPGARTGAALEITPLGADLLVVLSVTSPRQRQVFAGIWAIAAALAAGALVALVRYGPAGAGGGAWFGALVAIGLGGLAGVVVASRSGVGVDREAAGALHARIARILTERLGAPRAARG